MNRRLPVVAQLLPQMESGGAERGALDLVREHAGVVQHIIISGGGRLAAEAIRLGALHLRIPMASKNPLSIPWRVRQLRLTLKTITPDIVHVRSRIPAWLHYLANRHLQLPTVSTVHGINSVNRYSRIMTVADAIICPGIAVARHIEKSYGTETAKITVIGRGVDMDYFNPAAVNWAVIKKLRQQWDLQNKRVILQMGRLTAQKGHDVLLQALAKIPASQRHHWAVLMVGGGNNRRQRRLVSLARRLGVAECVRWTGTQDNPREWLMLADVALSCAIKPESFGRTIAEALAMNTPVIATAHGGALDIINPEEIGGRLLPPGDASALAAALTEPMPDASAARARIAARFTAPKMAADTLKVYQKILTMRAK